LSVNEIQAYLQPFVDNFINSREMAEFFKQFIRVEDRLSQYEQFWTVWSALYDKVKDLSLKGNTYYSKEIIYNYLFAGISWNEKAKEWHTFKRRECAFFKKASEEMGQHSAVLYAISKILNEVASGFIDDGLEWISYILEKNQELELGDLESNTIFYIENLIRKFILTNRMKIKKSILVKKRIITILNYLVESGSIVGYLLRDDIL